MFAGQLNGTVVASCIDEAGAMGSRRLMLRGRRCTGFSTTGYARASGSLGRVCSFFAPVFIKQPSCQSAGPSRSQCCGQAWAFSLEMRRLALCGQRRSLNGATDFQQALQLLLWAAMTRWFSLAAFTFTCTCLLWIKGSGDRKDPKRSNSRSRKMIEALSTR